ncbi:hypothetical protein K439DRAFT_1374435 [Ramaria rubella]|nr:hypothetical protein K439DRAFT_1374435 [Ramaria rubella]
MTPRLEDDWSDSEDEQGGSGSDIETSVLLGIPDGEIDEPLDLSDPSVSRIGGHPVFLPTRQLSHSSSHCNICNYPMPLLVQMWCPFEGSSMDRVLHVWGCERPECQRKDGSIRVWRGLKFNSKYAAKLAKKKAREAEQLAKRAAEDAQKKLRNVNPFSVRFSAGASAEGSFGLGTQLFGGDAPPNNEIDTPDDSLSNSASESDGGEDDCVDVLSKQIDSTKLESPGLPTAWSFSPSYKPVYLSTISEYIPLPPKAKVKPEEYLNEDIDDSKKGGKEWGLEGWESSMDADGVFDRFVKRVAIENEQCVRYDLKGTPLPFGSRDKVYDQLWPLPPPPPFTTKPGFAAPIAQRRAYNSISISKCAVCGSPRVFECQLMPNLINVLRAQGKGTGEPSDSDTTRQEPREIQTEEERKNELKAMLKTGMEWGTCLIFSCAGDCSMDGQESWNEEVAIIQWDE